MRGTLSQYIYTANVTNATHSGEVTGTAALTVAANIQAAGEVIWAYDLDFHQKFFGTQFLPKKTIYNKTEIIGYQNISGENLKP